MLTGVLTGVWCVDWGVVLTGMNKGRGVVC